MEQGLSETSPSPLDGATAAHPVIDALRLEGAQHMDPVRFHYIEVLARRASAQQGSVQRILDGKLEAAVATLRRRLEQARGETKERVTRERAEPGETLGDLVRHMAQHTPEKADGRTDGPTTAARSELKSVTYFRNTWSKLSAEKQVTQALGQAPKNAGPINSHVVALRSLELMRDISPDYLNRFMSYVDTLLRLEQGDKGPLPAAKPMRSGKAAKRA